MAKSGTENNMVRVPLHLYQQLDKLRFGWGLSFAGVISKLIADAKLDIEDIALDRLSK